MSKDKAIEEAVDFAIKENFLDGFFKTQRAEIIGMILTEYNEELIHKNWHEDGYIEGHDDGRNEKAEEDAKNFKAKGIDIHLIAECTGLSVEKVQKL